MFGCSRARSIGTVQGGMGMVFENKNGGGIDMFNKGHNPDI